MALIDLYTYGSLKGYRDTETGDLLLEDTRDRTKYDANALIGNPEQFLILVLSQIMSLSDDATPQSLFGLSPIEGGE